jgi:hypothetical protein
MAVFRIPTSTDPERPHYTQRTSLDGRTYLLELRWNGRQARWFLDLYTANGSVIRTGILIRVNWPLLRLVTDERAPPGVLMAIDRSGALKDPGLTELGSRVELLYFDESEGLSA